MHKYVAPGKALDYSNSSGSTIATGKVLMDTNNLFMQGITTRPIPDGESSGICREQGAIFDFDKGADVFAIGEPVNLNLSTNMAVRTPVASGTIIALGRCVVAALTGDSQVRVAVDFTHNRRSEQAHNSIRVRSTIAEVNAGKTLLPAIPGFKYVIRDIRMIAVGGAAAASTTVDVLATQSSVSVKLLAVAVAALTQSALVRAGAANATILADGASFVACDANTAVTLSKTGSALTTATNIDVFIDYTIELA